MIDHVCRDECECLIQGVIVQNDLRNLSFDLHGAPTPRFDIEGQSLASITNTGIKDGLKHVY